MLCARHACCACVHLPCACMCPLHPPRRTRHTYGGIDKEINRHKACREYFTSIHGIIVGGSPLMYSLPLSYALSPVNQGGGTHGFPIPICMCVHARVWFFHP